MEKELQIINEEKLTKENQEIKEFLEVLKNVLFEFDTDTEISINMLEMNLHTELSSIVKQTIANPIGMTYKAFLQLEEGLFSTLNLWVLGKIAELKQYIKKIYRLKKGQNALHYSILFKDNKDFKKIFPLLREYQGTVYNQKFPLIIQDIPNELEKEFLKDMKTNKNFEEIQI